MTKDVESTPPLRRLLTLCLSQHFGIEDAAFQTYIAEQADYLEVVSGEYLLRDGEHSDEVFFLLTGHLRALKTVPPKTEPQILGEIGRGETVGELAMFTGRPRSADVIAIRDCVVARISRDVMESAIAQQPTVAIQITKQIIHRFERAQAVTRPPATPVNVTFLPLGDSVDVAALTTELADIRRQRGDDIRRLDGADIAASFGGLDGPDVTLPRGPVSLGIGDLELAHDALYFITDPSEPAWCQTAVHHSDEVVLVADATTSPDVTEIEAKLLSGHRNLRVPTTLVMVHPAGTKSPSDTAAWLDVRHVNRHVHIRAGHAGDMARLSRILSGRAIGLVLAGGGARGLTHLGIMAALDEAGVVFDYVGGTSAGAIMGSFAAMDVAGDKMKVVSRDSFVDGPIGSITGDYNWVPYLSLLKGGRALKASERAIATNATSNMDMADCWKNYFVIASNFSTHQEQILTRGDLAVNVVASSSIPGVMPPTLMDGELLFDGGSFNNFPVDRMRAMGAAKIIGVDLLPDLDRRYELPKIPTSGQALRDRFRPRGKRRYRLPTLPATLLSASVVTSMARQKAMRDDVDILFQPDTRGITLLDWSKFDLAFERGLDHGREILGQLDVQFLDDFRNAPHPKNEA